jgi:hypothetical protein
MRHAAINADGFAGHEAGYSMRQGGTKASSIPHWVTLV